MIYLAYEICIDNTEKMNVEYMDKILKSWHEKGVKTPADAERVQQEWAESRKKSGKKKSESGAADAQTASYDLDAFTKKSLGLKYKSN